MADGDTTGKAHKYSRVLLKISGESLMGQQAYGIDTEMVASVAREVKDVVADGVEVCLVIGGGNIFRGVSGAAAGMERYWRLWARGHAGNRDECTGDAERAGTAGRAGEGDVGIAYQRCVRTLYPPPRDAASGKGPGGDFCRREPAIRFYNGYGSCTQGLEMNCNALLKGTRVDGVYSADPEKDPTATRYDRLSYLQVLSDDLRVMDASAICWRARTTFPFWCFPSRIPVAFSAC